jgi:hypothetical protein
VRPPGLDPASDRQSIGAGCGLAYVAFSAELTRVIAVACLRADAAGASVLIAQMIRAGQSSECHGGPAGESYYDRGRSCEHSFTNGNHEVIPHRQVGRGELRSDDADFRLEWANGCGGFIPHTAIARPWTFRYVSG